MYNEMPKKNSSCKKYCDWCKRPSMPSNGNNFRGSKSNVKSTCHWICTAVAVCIIGALGLQAFSSSEAKYNFKYYKPSIDQLRAKPEAIRISGIDFVSDSMKEKMQALGDRMKTVCNERSDDVVFAFQFGKGRRREDHVFALCGSPVQVFGNAEVIARSGEFIMCTEEFDGTLQQIRRPSSVSIKAIDVSEWESIEYDVTTPKESCIIQHSIDVLESKWI